MEHRFFCKMKMHNDNIKRFQSDMLMYLNLAQHE